jgi:hypothetical protein
MINPVIYKPLGGYAILAAVVLIVAYVSFERHYANHTSPVIPTPKQARRVEPEERRSGSEERRSGSEERRSRLRLDHKPHHETAVRKHRKHYRPRPEPRAINERSQTYSVCYDNGLCYRQVCNSDGICLWAWY